MSAPELPLAGRHVLVPPARPEESPLVALLRRRGAAVREFPLLRAEAPAPAPLAATLGSSAPWDWILFAGSRSVEHAFAALPPGGALPAARVAAVGHGAVTALKRLGRPADVVPERHTAPEVAAALGELAGRRLLLVRVEGAAPDLPAALAARGAVVEQVAGYRMVAAPDAAAARAAFAAPLDALALANPSAVRYLDEAARGAALDLAAATGATLVAAAGPATAAAAARRGLAPGMVAGGTIRALVDALVDALRPGGAPLLALVATLAVAAVAACGPPATSPPARTAASAPGRGGATLAPSYDECDELWGKYRTTIPQDPYVDRTTFLDHCQRSERDVLSCYAQARAAVADIVHRSGGPAEAESNGQLDRVVLKLIARVALPSRMGICVTRERARAAERHGELAELGAAIASGRLKPDADGLLVAPGVYASLPWRGLVELDGGTRLAPPGEVRVRRLPDGRVWIYLLGGLLGRHQNQVGFLYSTAPFAAADFARGEGGRDRVCLGPASDAAARGAGRRYLLWCFSVTARLGARLLEVGAAPD